MSFVLLYCIVKWNKPIEHPVVSSGMWNEKKNSELAAAAKKNITPNVVVDVGCQPNTGITKKPSHISFIRQGDLTFTTSY